MKRILIIAFIATVGLLTGCLEHDWSLCTNNENCRLIFKYEDEQGNDLFSDKISSVDIFLFRDGSDLALRKRVEKNDLQAFAGVTLTVPPGKYKVVCWSNVDEQSQISIPDNAPMDLCSLEILSSESGNPLYYSPYKEPVTRSGNDPDDNTIVVPEMGTIEKSLIFSRAHRTVSIYMNNYNDPAEGRDVIMKAEGAPLPFRYDFLRNSHESRKTYSALMKRVNTPNGIMPMAQMHMPYCSIGNDMNFTVKRVSDDSDITTVNLKNHIDINMPGQTGADLDDIRIMITYGEAGAEVTVTIPDWDDKDVEPIW